jgi:hypothetical protein
MNEHQTLLHAWQVGRQTYRLLLLQVLYEMAVSDSKWKSSLFEANVPSADNVTGNWLCQSIHRGSLIQLLANASARMAKGVSNPTIAM